MKDEIEAKFVDVDFSDIREKLKIIGAELVSPMRSMRRVIIDNPALKNKDAFVRVRDEGNKITVAYKQFSELSINGAKEIEITVSDFDKAVALLAAAGLAHSSFQETRRETWKLNDTEIMLDEWPWLNPYIEIEGPSEDHVMSLAKQLGLDWKDAVFGDVMAAYRIQYPHLTEKDTVGNLPEVKFGASLPDLLKN